MREGQRVFRYETFGDEAFWGDTLQLHKAIEGSKHGGVGLGVSPKAALSVGLKVDVDNLPEALVIQLKAGKVDLDDPATTLALLKLKAVVGVTGFFNANGGLRSMGIQCAICHSTVDDSLAPGIGHRLDGWANRDLNVGAIVSLAPDLSVFTNLLGVDESTVKKVLASWGPGKYDAELNLDGKAFRPDGKPAAVLLPPAFGLAGVNQHTWGGGWGNVTYWNAFVANLQMHGQGVFYDRRLMNAEQYPVAAKAGYGNMRPAQDKVTAHLAALEFYQLAMPAPAPPEGSFDKAAAARGADLFKGKAQCAQCHVPPLFTEPGWNTHKAEDIGIDDFQANRSPDRSYRTAPLRGLWSHQKGGFYHDGRFAALRDVIEHYDSFKRLGLAEQQNSDLIEYLKSL
jgi:mono/diheme cytochrome c family protein